MKSNQLLVSDNVKKEACSKIVMTLRTGILVVQCGILVFISLYFLLNSGH